MINYVISINTFNLDEEDAVNQIITNYTEIKNGKIDGNSPIHYAIEISES